MTLASGSRDAAHSVMRIESEGQAFFATATVLTGQMMDKLGSYKMTIIDLPMNIVYGVCLLGFIAMTLRSVLVARVNWQRGYSVLQRPETTMADR